MVEARRAGVRPKELADTLGVSPALIHYWAKTAGVPPMSPPSGGTPAYPCGACAHPDRESIDVALATTPVRVVEARFPELTAAILDRHRRIHLGLAGFGQHAALRSCAVCDHPSRDDIDRALTANESRVSLAESTGIPCNVLRTHQSTHLNNPERDQAQAVAAVRRLAVVREIMES